MLQRLPPGSGIDDEEPGFGFNRELVQETEDEGWRRAIILLSTCTPAELTDPKLTAQDLVFRLFHEEGVGFGRLPRLKQNAAARAIGSIQSQRYSAGRVG